MPPIVPQPRFPMNRVVAFLGPYLAIVSGALAAWLGRHFPGLDVNLGATARGITQASEFAVGALITWALHHKYLTGWQQWERGLIEIQLAQTAAVAEPPGTRRPSAAAAFDLGPPAWSPGAFGPAAESQNGAEAATFPAAARG